MKTTLSDCLELIRTDFIRDLVARALSSANGQFFRAPASSTGKYHPPEDCGDGGLVVHTRKLVQVAMSLFRFFEVNNEKTQDKIIAACILHDVCKNGVDWEERYTIKEHGAVAAKWIMTLRTENENKRDIEDIAELVRDHMAIWNKPPTPALTSGKVLKNRDICHLIVQLSDYFSSRKWASFFVDDFMSA